MLRSLLTRDFSCIFKEIGMADAWGVLTFAKSEDCDIDGKSLVESLNQFQWDKWGGKWEYYEDVKSLYYSNGTAQYPTVFPEIKKIVHCYSEESDSNYSKLVSEMTSDDWDNYEDSDDEYCSLEELKNILIPHIKQGWIEIACCSSEKQRYITFQSLRIDKSNPAIRTSCSSGPADMCLNIVEKV